MKKSLTQIITAFRTFASSHKQIEAFETKPLSENIANNLVYPLMFIDVQAMNASFIAGAVNINVPIYMLDRIERDYSNLVSVLSNALLKMDDFYTYFNDHECGVDGFGFNFSNNLSATPVVYEFDDLVAGYSAVIVCQVGVSRNESQIPI